jgi:transposase
VAETGSDMTRFASSARLAAWAGLAPGDTESAGSARRPPPVTATRISGPAWWQHGPAPVPPPGLAPGSGGWPTGSASSTSKAAVAVAHTLLCIAWAVMKNDSDYAEAGADYCDQRDQRNHEHLARHHQQARAQLGHQVTLVPPGDRRPPPGSPQQPAA